MLKVNTTLTSLNLSGELCLVWIFHSVFQLIRFCDILNDYNCCDKENPFDDDGVRAIAEALKVNTTLADVNLHRE